jgi:probable LLM family oxidoreductase
MEIGIDTFVPAAGEGQQNVRCVAEALDQIELADQVGVDVVGVGEHHRPDYVASSPAVFLAAAAARTRRIRLASAVTVLSSDDPVRVFQQFATVDLISNGRAEIIVGRGSFTESYPLFGFDLADYDELFEEKLNLLLKIREQTHVKWSGKHRAPLTGQGVYPRPVQNPLPIRVGVGGTPQSFLRAGRLGLPLIVAIIGGEPWRFRPMIDAYRRAAAQAGHDPSKLEVGIHTFGFLADTTEAAKDAFIPAYLQTMNKIGRERGWSPMSRAHCEQLTLPRGALLLGTPREVADKILHVSEALGGIKRVTIQLNPSNVSDALVRHAIQLMGTELKPAVNASMAAATA